MRIKRAIQADENGNAEPVTILILDEEEQEDQFEGPG